MTLKRAAPSPKSPQCSEMLCNDRETVSRWCLLSGRIYPLASEPFFSL